MTDDHLGTTRFEFFPEQLARPPWTSDLPAHVSTYHGAVALPLASPRGSPRILGAVYDDHGRLIRDTQRAKTNRAWAGNPDRQPTDPTEVDTFAGTTFFGGHARPAFGHVLLEILPRFWPESELAEVDRVVFYGTRAATPSRRPQLTPYAIDLLGALGVAAERCHELGPRAVKFERLVVASPAFWLKRGFNPKVRLPFRRCGDVLAAAASTNGPATPRIYLSRSRLGPSSRRALNEAAIEDIATGAGFVVLHPEELPISTQIRLVREADVIAGCDGSAMHLAAFARPGTKLVAFDSRLVPNQYILNQAAELDALHAYVVNGPPSHRVGHWLADLDRVRAALDTALG